MPQVYTRENLRRLHMESVRKGQTPVFHIILAKTKKKKWNTTQRKTKREKGQEKKQKEQRSMYSTVKDNVFSE